MKTITDLEECLDILNLLMRKPLCMVLKWWNLLTNWLPRSTDSVNYLEFHTLEKVSLCIRLNSKFIFLLFIGKYINYDGDIDDEEELLDWLTNPDNMQLTDRIESVNRKMFQKIRQTSDYVAVFFCKYILLGLTTCMFTWNPFRQWRLQTMSQSSSRNWAHWWWGRRSRYQFCKNRWPPNGKRTWCICASSDYVLQNRTKRANYLCW